MLAVIEPNADDPDLTKQEEKRTPRRRVAEQAEHRVRVAWLVDGSRVHGLTQPFSLSTPAGVMHKHLPTSPRSIATT